MSGVSGGAGGLSASGGAAGPARSGLTSNTSFNVGGNAGIGSNAGVSLPTIAIMGLIAIALLMTFTRGKR